MVDENGEPLVVYHGIRWNPLDEADGQGVSRYDNISGTSEGAVSTSLLTRGWRKDMGTLRRCF
ncbi:MAG: hypothetical protein ACI4QD_05855 [Kiritimatiellia bacterium]